MALDNRRSIPHLVFYIPLLFSVPWTNVVALTFHNNKLTEPLDYSMCTLSVLTGKAEMVELGVNCPLCSCTGMTNICSERCYDGYYFNAAQAEAECEAFREAHPPVVDEADDFYW